MKIKKIFSKKLAYELRLQGCKLIGTEPNTYKPQFDVYLFEDNELLKTIWSNLNKNR